MKEHVDVVLSHDWPKGIHNYGDVDRLLRRKPFFLQEVENDALGSRPLFEVLSKLQPSYWFSAHMHVKFEAIVRNESVPSAEEVMKAGLPLSGNQPTPNQKMTKFLALDKVLPRRQFLQIIEIPCDIPSEDLKLQYDAEWLAVLKSTNHLVSSKSKTCFMPGPGFNARFDFTPTQDEINEVISMFSSNLEIPLNFIQTAPPHHQGEQPQRAFPVTNPQTSEFCNKLGITDPIVSVIPSEDRKRGNSSFIHQDESDMERYASQLDITMNSTLPVESLNPDEISLDMDDEDESHTADKNKNSESHADMESPSTSQCQPSEESKSSFRRRKLDLPAPSKCSADEICNAELEEDGTQREGVDADELKLLQSVLGTATDEISDTQPQRIQNTDHFFVIDTQGDSNNLPKKRRNASFYDED